MDNFWESVGVALIILAIAIGIKGCLTIGQPFFGVNGSIVATTK